MEMAIWVKIGVSNPMKQAYKAILGKGKEEKE
jgi:hypothetical protein